VQPSGRAVAALSAGAGPPKTDEATGPLLTVREVAARLRLSTATVYRLCADGAIKHVRVSNAVRIPAGGLRRFLGES
jgi:excisionase family DNA binding protein